MADKQTDGKGKGTPRPGDQTTQPGQYPSKMPFGIQVPTSTGAPGSSPAPSGPDDATTKPGQVPMSVFGMPVDEHTGAPGSAGASAGVAGGATYTDPFATLAGGGKGSMSGGSTDSEAQANKYGTNTMWGVAGPGQPDSTGAGHGTVREPRA